jgi:hypothetical protein
MRNSKFYINPTVLAEYATYCLLFLMAFVPFEQQIVKLALVGFVVFTVLLLALRTRVILIHLQVLVWFLILIGTGAFFVFWGILRGSMDALKVFPVFVLYPVVYIFLTGSIARSNSIKTLFRLLVGTSFAISIFSAIYMLSMFGVLPFEGIFSIVGDAVVSVDAEFISYAMPSITSMLYLVPFLLSALLLWDNADDIPVKRRWLGMAMLFSFVTIIFSSTRVFWVILILTPVLTFFSIFMLEKSERRDRRKVFFGNLRRMFVMLVIFAIVPIIYFYSDLTDMFLSSSTFMDALTFTDTGSSVRGEQFKMLIEGWFEVPLLGAGHGASLPAYRRSDIAPWAYELSFVALLFQTGLIGVFCYVVEILWLFYMGWKLSRAREKVFLYITPTLVGLFCFLIATGTNPYLYAFDHLWTIFITLMLINMVMLNGGKNAT